MKQLRLSACEQISNKLPMCVENLGSKVHQDKPQARRSFTKFLISSENIFVKSKQTWCGICFAKSSLSGVGNKCSYRIPRIIHLPNRDSHWTYIGFPCFVNNNDADCDQGFELLNSSQVKSKDNRGCGLFVHHGDSDRCLQAKLTAWCD